MTLQRGPFKVSELTSGHFPTLGGIASHDIADANIGGTFNFTYSLPTKFQTSGLHANFEFWGSENDAEYDKELRLDESSASFTTGQAWTPTGAELEIEANDVFRRSVVLHWYWDD